MATESKTTPVIRRTIQRLSDAALHAALEQAKEASSDPSEYWLQRLEEIQAEMKERKR